MRKLKVMTFIGTRPEIIRLSRTMVRLDEFTEHIIVHTGQNYDYELNEIFFKDLELRKPDYFLEVDTTSQESSVGDIFKKSGEVLRKENPDAVLVLGDTNSCLSAYMAKRLHIPVFHMEAGNRCFDFNVPEEINRRIIDHISDFNLVYTEHARRHLISEGLPQRRIYLTGSPMKEVLDHYLPKIEQSGALEKLSLTSGKYFLISAHREENVDNQENLSKILSILNMLAEEYKLPVIVSTHPRTRKRLELLTDMKMEKSIHFLKPFGFIDYIFLQMNAVCVVSDSGTISEESSILNFPAISLRQSMERPEAQD
jgi:UDP-N-acetylglucosamine 2-epimerase (non-hydrolysing)